MLGLLFRGYPDTILNALLTWPWQEFWFGTPPWSASAGRAVAVIVVTINATTASTDMMRLILNSSISFTIPLP
jgi:hypothetical protein